MCCVLLTGSLEVDVVLGQEANGKIKAKKIMTSLLFSWNLNFVSRLAHVEECKERRLLNAELLDPVREGLKATSARPKGEGVVAQCSGTCQSQNAGGDASTKRG